MFIRIASATLLLATLAACSNSSLPQAATAAPSGIQTTGSAGMTGGPAAAPANSGVVSSTTRP